MRFVTLASAATLTFAGAAAHAVEVTKTADYAASAEKVWAASANDFCGLGNFHPAVEKCVLSEKGEVRTLSLKGGGTLVEKRTANSDGKSYSYEITEGLLPVANYKSTFTVTPKGGSASSVTWTGNFEPKGADEAAATKVIEGIYTSGLDALKTKL